MSYKKQTISTVDVVTFYYVTDLIFNEVSQTTSFKAASVLKPDGQPDFDRLQITDDEKAFMKRYLKEAMLEIFSLMFKIISGDSVIHDTVLIFDDATDDTAGAFVVGSTYTILSAGDTDFTLIGAADSVAGTTFTATGVGTGTGTANLSRICSYSDILDNDRYRTINLDLIDQKINNALVDFILFKWYSIKGLGDDAAIHLKEFGNGLIKISEKTLPLRQPV